ncbi:hypothetical protein CEXT_778281 [Caerostris extrusa]|uniref:Uncharacterized protein n=1 Tax=Caerostris extrusa TaxID=172846 RepID=A0AAV4R7B0_CAEEX|nr:hypothetical protein CEXT_778281 [Caerostris extrusa]
MSPTLASGGGLPQKKAALFVNTQDSCAYFAIGNIRPIEVLRRKVAHAREEVNILKSHTFGTRRRKCSDVSDDSESLYASLFRLFVWLLSSLLSLSGRGTNSFREVIAIYPLPDLRRGGGSTPEVDNPVPLHPRPPGQESESAEPGWLMEEDASPFCFRHAYFSNSYPKGLKARFISIGLHKKRLAV